MRSPCCLCVLRVCIYIPLCILHNVLVFYAVRVISNESGLFLRRISCNSIGQFLRCCNSIGQFLRCFNNIGQFLRCCNSIGQFLRCCNSIGQFLRCCNSIGQFLRCCNNIGQFLRCCNNIGQFLLSLSLSLSQNFLLLSS
jgi:hypothetical protein